jgi:hypothetical protein
VVVDVILEVPEAPVVRKVVNISPLQRPVRNHDMHGLEGLDVEQHQAYAVDNSGLADGTNQLPHLPPVHEEGDCGVCRYGLLHLVQLVVHLPEDQAGGAVRVLTNVVERRSLHISEKRNEFVYDLLPPEAVRIQQRCPGRYLDEKLHPVAKWLLQELLFV